MGRGCGDVSRDPDYQRRRHVRLFEQFRGSKIVDGGHGTIWIIRISVDRVALPA